jgi:hypothetical protein
MRDLRILPEGIKTQISRVGSGAPPSPSPSTSRFGASPPHTSQSVMRNQGVGISLGDPLSSFSAPPSVAVKAADPAPYIISAPVATGSAYVGQTLHSTSGKWGGSNLTFSYQWLRNGSLIIGATTPTYTVVSEDMTQAAVDATFACRVVATNLLGSTQSPPSNPLSTSVWTVSATVGVTYFQAPSAPEPYLGVLVESVYAVFEAGSTYPVSPEAPEPYLGVEVSNVISTVTIGITYP